MHAEFGFSYIGLLYLLMLFIPNGLWAKHKPKDYSSNTENKLLHAFEMLGQMLSTFTIVIFTNFNYDAASTRLPWFFLSLLCMLLYEYQWYRYFKGDQTAIRMYEPLWGIPLPLATLPVAAFFLLGIYGNVIWLCISSVILGIGHIGIHWMHIKELKNKGKG